MEKLYRKNQHEEHTPLSAIKVEKATRAMGGKIKNKRKKERNRPVKEGYVGMTGINKMQH
jgi:hypothetical protein